MKKLICFFLCTILVIGNTAAYADIPKFRYSFEEALEMAMKNYEPELKNYNRKISDAYDTFELADKFAPQDIKFTGSMKIFIERQVDPYMNAEGAYSNYQMAILNRNNFRRTIELGLRQAVIGVLKTEIACSETDISRKNLQNQLEILEIRYENGLIGRNDYNDEKKKIKDNIKALDDVEDMVDLAYRQLNTMLGREDEKDIEVNLNDTVIPLEKLNLEQIKKDMIRNGKAASDKDNYSLRQLQENRSLAKYRYELIKERYDKYDLDKFTDQMRSDIEDMYQEAKENFELADKAYSNALDRFNKSFDDMIEDIEDLYADIEELKEDIAYEKEKMALNKLLYETGRMTKIEYDALGDKITLMENDLKALELDLNMKYAELLIYSDLKKVVKE